VLKIEHQDEPHSLSYTQSRWSRH